MPIDATKAALAVSQGLSAICATCEKYWRARDMGVPNGACLAQRECGGPIAGNVFQEYEGPLPHFENLCFVCGAEPSHAIRVAGYVRVIGCCAEHVDMVKRVKPVGKHAPRLTFLSKDGEEMIDEESPAPPVKLRIGG